MDINEYQKLAMRTLNPKIEKKELILTASMGLCGESGEVIDLVKKHLFQGHDLDDEKLIKELGDVAWYLAEAATALNVNLSEILEKNIKKLENRFPDGFNNNRSINRGE